MQVQACCDQSARLYLDQCWSRPRSLYGITRHQQAEPLRLEQTSHLNFCSLVAIVCQLMFRGVCYLAEFVLGWLTVGRQLCEWWGKREQLIGPEDHNYYSTYLVVEELRYITAKVQLIYWWILQGPNQGWLCNIIRFDEIWKSLSEW